MDELNPIHFFKMEGWFKASFFDDYIYCFGVPVIIPPPSNFIGLIHVWNLVKNNKTIGQRLAVFTEKDGITTLKVDKFKGEIIEIDQDKIEFISEGQEGTTYIFERIDNPF